MNNAQLDALLREIKLKALDAEDDEVFKNLTAARKVIQKWQKNGMSGAMPYRTKLKEWGVLAEAGETSVNSESIPAPEENAIFAGIDPALQRAYEEAQTAFDNKRYYLAKNSYRALLVKVDTFTPFGQEVEEAYEEAARKLEKAVAPLIKKVRQYARRYPKKLDTQRELWQAVLQEDPDNEIAKQALKALETEDSRVRIETEAERIQRSVEGALQKDDLPTANAQLANIQALAKENKFSDLQPQLDALVAEMTRQRRDLRDKLGATSTLAVSGNLREAYRQTREYLGKNVPVMVDSAGLFGVVDAEIPTGKIAAVIRKRFLKGLMDLTEQHRKEAESLEKESPNAAKKKLQGTLALLDDDILTGEDWDELKEKRQAVESALALVEERISRYEQARALVLQADEAGRSYEEKRKLYREAREIYFDYPNINRYIEDAQDALAAQTAGRVRDRMTQIQLDLRHNEFKKALDGVAGARTWALSEIPRPKENSTLEKILQELERLNGEIIEADGRYHQMMNTLAKVDALLDEYADTQSPNLLSQIRQWLDGLPAEQAQSSEMQQRRVRLTNLQGDRENWRQGRKAYRIGQWQDAFTYLQKVADSPNAQNQEEAERLAKRAEAALYVNEGQQAEREREWGHAINRYRGADLLFNKYGTDSQTNSLQEICKDKLESLKSVEENDRRVHNSIAQAKSLLEEAKQSVTERKILLAQVESIPQFAQAITMLLDARTEKSTLTAKLERALRVTREAWRTSYLQGMEQASRSDDLNILRKAIERGKELQSQQLLFEADDKKLLRYLQEQMLDAEYDQMLASKTTAPISLEKNRRQRWEIANPEEHDELYKQYQEAVERRVLMALGKEQNKNAAFHYLRKEMLQPELYQSERLFREFMHLCWESNNWEDAQRQAKNLAYRAHVAQAQEKSKIWKGLVQAAQLLGDGNKSSFETELERVQVVGQTGSDLSTLLEQEREWLIAWRLEALLRKARKAESGEDDQQLIEAAQWYAEAHALRSTDIGVRTGLQNLGQKLNSSLEIYGEQARNVGIRQSLPESIRRAEKLLSTIDSIQQVQDVLNLSSDTIGVLTDGRERVDAKLTPWRKVQGKFVQLAEMKNDYLGYPDPLRPDGSGGWRVAELDTQIAPLRQDARGDRELMSRINERQEEISMLAEKADALNEQVSKLAQAVEHEDFSEVAAAASKLERLWQHYQPDGFAGLSDLIRHRYPYTGREVRQLREHQETSERQQTNLEEWENWAARTKKAYQEVTAIGSRIDKDVDDLRQEKSLKEIKEDCVLVMAKTAAFGDELEGIPDDNPISQKADKARNQVSDSWQREVLDAPTSYQERANNLLNQIKEDEERIQKPLKQMKSVMRTLEAQIRDHEESKDWSWPRKKKPFPLSQFRNATKRVKACQKIDPIRESVTSANKKLRKIKQKYGVE